MSPDNPRKEKVKVLHEDWCKGCGICVYVCPKNVLCIEEGKVKILSPDDCIACKVCELSCPDFVLKIR